MQKTTPHRFVLDVDSLLCFASLPFPCIWWVGSWEIIQDLDDQFSWASSHDGGKHDGIGELNHFALKAFV